MQAERTERKPLTRLPRDPDEGWTRYLHPHGYVVCYERRSWSERVGAMRGASLASSYDWWAVYLHASTSREHHYQPWAHKPRPVQTFDTLRDAREFCDVAPREGWIDAA